MNTKKDKRIETSQAFSSSQNPNEKMGQNEGKIVAIVAPSGAGKSTLLARLKEDFPDLHESISYTTRPIRKGEVEGKSYFFITKEDFQEMMKRDAFIEWAIVHGDHYYGSAKDQVEKYLAKGTHVLFEIDIQGADRLKGLYGHSASVIFIAPPSFEDLKKRLLSRNTESEVLINIRLETAKKEMTKKDAYDYLVINDDFERAYLELKRIVSAILEN